MRFFIFILLFFLSVCGSGLPVSVSDAGASDAGASGAGAGPWQGDAQMQARLVSATQSLNDEGVLEAGLEVRLAEGWKIYWRSPGAGGLPPVLDFTRSKGVLWHRLDFPAPERFSILGFDSFGYSERVIYPLTVYFDRKALASERHVVLVAGFAGLVCRDICVPVEEVLTLSLPYDFGGQDLGGGGEASRFAQDIARFKARVPRASTSKGVRITGAAIEGGAIEGEALGEALGEGRGGALVLDFEVGDGEGDSAFLTPPVDILIEHFSGEPFSGEPLLGEPFSGENSSSVAWDYAFSRPQWQVRGDSGRAVLTTGSGGSLAELAGREIIVTAIGKDWLLESPIAVSRTISPPTSSLASPVNEASGLKRFLSVMVVAFLGGVILNIMPCVLPVLSLKLGAVLGKGGAALSQVRRSFLSTAAGVVFSFMLLGLVLLGLRQAGVSIGWGIQFQQPLFLGLAALAIAGFGVVMLDWVVLPVPRFAQNLPRSPNISGSSFGGDFMAGALATVLATPCSAPFVGTAVSFALAAPPFLMLAVFLSMGVGLASPWFLVAGFPRFVRLLPHPGAWFKHVKRFLAIGLFATSGWLFWVLFSVLGVWGVGGDGGWEVWRVGLAEARVRQGAVVFVDVTADWCITCKANKVLVLETQAMEDIFAEAGVVRLRADWTAPNDAITDYLASFGRYGIPFNVVYGPRFPGGIVLPEVLTVGDIRIALRRAGL